MSQAFCRCLQIQKDQCFSDHWFTSQTWPLWYNKDKQTMELRISYLKLARSRSRVRSCRLNLWTSFAGTCSEYEANRPKVKWASRRWPTTGRRASAGAFRRRRPWARRPRTRSLWSTRTLAPEKISRRAFWATTATSEVLPGTWSAPIWMASIFRTWTRPRCDNTTLWFKTRVLRTLLSALRARKHWKGGTGQGSGLKALTNCNTRLDRAQP